jgi:hypothetical protein
MSPGHSFSSEPSRKYRLGKIIEDPQGSGHKSFARVLTLFHQALTRTSLEESFLNTSHLSRRGRLSSQASPDILHRLPAS